MAWGDVISPSSPWWVPIDPADIAQEKALALLERRCPNEAAKAWIRRERSWYRFHQRFPKVPPNINEGDFIDDWIERFYCAIAPKITPNRSADSIDKRREQVREWWRKNGREYRRQRQSQGCARRNERPGSGAHARTD